MKYYLFCVIIVGRFGTIIRRCKKITFIIVPKVSHITYE